MFYTRVSGIANLHLWSLGGRERERERARERAREKERESQSESQRGKGQYAQEQLADSPTHQFQPDALLASTP